MALITCSPPAPMIPVYDVIDKERRRRLCTLGYLLYYVHYILTPPHNFIWRSQMELENWEIVDEKRPEGREKSKTETVSKVVINSKQTGTITSYASA